MGLAKRRRASGRERRPALNVVARTIVPAFGLAWPKRHRDALRDQPLSPRPDQAARRAGARAAQDLPWWAYVLFLRRGASRVYGRGQIVLSRSPLNHHLRG